MDEDLQELPFHYFEASGMREVCATKTCKPPLVWFRPQYQQKYQPPSAKGVTHPLETGPGSPAEVAVVSERRGEWNWNHILPPSQERASEWALPVSVPPSSFLFPLNFQTTNTLSLVRVRGGRYFFLRHTMLGGSWHLTATKVHSFSQEGFWRIAFNLLISDFCYRWEHYGPYAAGKDGCAVEFKMSNLI